MELKALLQEMIDKKASDVFIVAGLPLTYTARRPSGAHGHGAAHARRY